MKNLIILVIIGFGAFQFFEKYGNSVPPQFEGNYVSVYGRDSCGYTKKMLSELNSAGVKYHYFSVDDNDSADELHLRMKASGISTRRYNLPLVDVNGDITIRPKAKDVLEGFTSQL